MNSASNIFSTSKENFLDRLHDFLSPSCLKRDIERKISLVEQRLGSAQQGEAVGFGDRLIERYQTNSLCEKTLQAFDRTLRPLRENQNYLHPTNQKIYSKWLKLGLDPEIFHRFFEFAQFLESSKILSQLKTTKDFVRMEGEEPALLVEGIWTPWSEIQKRFSISEIPQQGPAAVDDSGSVYTYLGNGQGLQRFHPYLFNAFKPMAVLTNEELEETQSLAGRFPRADGESRPHVLQIVTAYTDRGGDSNFSRTLLKSRHSWIRFVAGEDLPNYGLKKGDVCSLGFEGTISRTCPFAISQGRFRSPDFWEYVSQDRQYTTCIPASKQEAENALKYALEIHRTNTDTEIGKKVGFYAPRQNCTIFVKEIAKQVGVDIPTHIGVASLLWKIAPDAVQNLGRQIRAWYRSATQTTAAILRAYTPQWLSETAIATGIKIRNYVRACLELLASFWLTLGNIFLGGARNNQETFEPLKLNGKPIKPIAQDLPNLPEIYNYWYSLPSQVVEWQEKQPSTISHLSKGSSTSRTYTI